MSLQRSQSAPYTLDVTWNFADPLVFEFDNASIPPGVSVTPSNGTLTNTTANPKIITNISAQNNALASLSNIRLTVKKSGGASATTSLALKVERKAGNFVFRQAPNVPPSTSPIFSPDGNFKAVITRQGTTRFYEAEFSTANDEVISTIPFEVQGGQLNGSGASNTAGVLFCHTSPTTTAAVISYDDLSSQPPPRHKLTTLVLTNPGRNSQKLISEFSYRFSYIPQIGFSPDCSVIAAVGATPDPTITSISDSGGVAAFIDAQTNSSVTFSFNDPAIPVSSSITAGRTINFSTPAGGSQSKTLP